MAKIRSRLVLVRAVLPIGKKTGEPTLDVLPRSGEKKIRFQIPVARIVAMLAAKKRRPTSQRAQTRNANVQVQFRLPLLRTVVPLRPESRRRKR